MQGNAERKAEDISLHQGWIYQIRGLAIIAVVVCHQQHILHESEVVQLLTLYSVTTLVFLMGYTAVLSYKKQLCSSGWSLRGYFWRLIPVLSEYAVATIIYANLFGRREDIGSNSILLRYLVDFSAAQLFYFVQYYISFSLISPFLIYLVRKIYCIERLNKIRWVLLSMVSIAVGFVGYWTGSTFPYWGGSYLFVYFSGVVMGYTDMRKVNKCVLGGLGVIVCMFGLYSSSVFYLNWVRGIFISTGIDALLPKLTLNPPNLSIILYSAGIIMVFYFVFETCNALKEEYVWPGILGNVFECLGRYSLDIYVWHIMIQNILVKYIFINNIWLKRLLFYVAQLFLPILGRIIFTRIKKDVSLVLSNKDMKC